ncbi:Peptidyl-prolyl cis-trans isomerase ssp-1 [Golovinomyces cichoracearum]|uniref:Peptidyl-prolyl cis-trans isomerase n=1 Tax=Golovinomyces cichoracearum TaxID=62708 RepID=A0A420J775_9PEZI|nr:Peptidyl-prolyl cis-trans isomerase ssp-1 [Golovinomyces cichoracearum]
MADAGLPFGWEVRHSKSKNLPYYFNEELKQSRWDPPPGTDHNRLRAYVLQHHSSALSESRPQAQELGLTTNDNEKIRASHLLVKHKDSRRPSSWREGCSQNSAEITRSKDDALKIMLAHEERIRCGVKTLGELAMTESDCSSAKKQGDLGFFGRGDMQKEFEDVAFTLRPGEISQIIETASGLHLIQRLE